ncbi:hypothetical protein [Insolitispirillum peregrinum]|uniref:hypothetical protein n=1 Tax=Insolitispirillum peregrinum TaxID=80876 RepID=UPI003612E297
MAARIILALPEQDDAFAAFRRAPWSERWTEAVTLPDGADDTEGWLAERFGALLRLWPSMTIPQPVAARIGLVITELDQLEDVLPQADLWGFIVFQPSRLAALDLMRRERQTLVAARALPLNHQLTVSDLAIRSGGGGIDAAQHDRVIGCRLQYPLQPGDDVTFGFLQWTGAKP